jgi:hypothetical protein
MAITGQTLVNPASGERITFPLVRGVMRFRMRRERITAGPDEVVVVPPGVPHDFRNAGDETALVRVEIRPALKIEQLFETAVALAEQGRTMLGGIPRPLELALFSREFEEEVKAAIAPRWLQRIALAPLAWIGRWRGRDLGHANTRTRRTQPAATAIEGCTP